MTKEPEEKRKRRKRRHLKKRILAILTLSVVIVVIIFSAKGVVALINKDKDNSSSQDSISTDNSSDIASLEPDSSEPESTQPSDSGLTNVSSSETPVLEVPDSSIPKPEQSWSTTLVNPANPLPDDFTTEVRTIKGTEKQYDVRAADSLEAMLADAEKAGYKMYLVSTYRTVKYQQGLFDRKTNEYKNKGFDEETARAEAAKWVAIPGSSEHNLGLAADIVSSTWYNNNSDLTESFENTEHFKWLYANCAQYGFILRYPKGDEAITGIAYEPWHYRYVGPEAAAYIMANELTLEEFHT